MNGPQKITRDILSISIIIIISSLVYFNTIASSFHYDDYVYILTNEAFEEYISHPFSIGHALSTLSNRSIVLASLYLNYSIGGFTVFGFHLVNLLIHIFTCLLIFTLLKKILKINVIASYKINIPLIAGLLFAVHPMNTQSVTYISNRSSLMATCFYLLSFLFFIKGLLQKCFPASLSNTNQINSSHKICYLKLFLFYILSVSFFVMGYGSKLIIITAPVLFFIFYLFFIPKKSSVTKKIFSDSLACIIMSAIVISPLVLIYISRYLNLQQLAETNTALLSKFLSPVLMTINVTKDYFSSDSYILTEFKVIVFYYLKMIFFPFNQNLDIDFPLADGLTDILLLFSLFLIVSALVIGFLFYKKNRLITFSIFWFYITLLPTSSLIPLIDTVAEHRLYLPSAGMVIIFSILLNNIYNRSQTYFFRYRINGIFIILLPVLIFSMLSIQRNFIWKDEVSIWLDASKKSPLLSRPLNNLGEAYEKNEEYKKAIQAFKKAIVISPNYDYAHNNLGTVYGKLNQFDLAINEYKLALGIKNHFPTAHFNLGKAYELKGMLSEANHEYSLTIEQKHNFYKAYFNLANLFSRQNNYQKAINTYKIFLKYKPSNPKAHFELGNIFVKMGNLEEAYRYFSRAIELDSNYLSAKIAAGNILMMKGKVNRAKEIYLQVLKTDPNNFTVYNNLGLIYMQHWNNPSRAIYYFRLSLKINPDQPEANSLKDHIENLSP